MEIREKLIKMDEKRREYDIVVIGEEPHLAYNRVGLTSFFQHRKAENLYLNHKDWVRKGARIYSTGCEEICADSNPLCSIPQNPKAP